MEEQNVGIHMKAASTSTDAQIWREILRKAEMGTTNEPYFVVETQHPSSFCKISLPAVFVDHHSNNLNAKMVLEDQDGYIWHARLGRTWKSKPYISHGWREFAAAHSLQIGDRVVFFLVAYAHFMVQVFDADNDEKLRRDPTAGCTPINTRKMLNLSESKSEKQKEEFEGGLELETSKAMKGALHQLPYHQVKVEDGAFARIPLAQQADELNKGKPMGLSYMKCSTTDGLEYVQILDTSSDEEVDMVPAAATPVCGQKHIDGKKMKSRPKKISQRSQDYYKEEHLSGCDEHKEEIEGFNRFSSKSDRKNPPNDDTTSGFSERLLKFHPSKTLEISDQVAETLHHDAVKGRTVQVHSHAGEDGNTKHVIQRDKILRKFSKNHVKEKASESDGIFHRNGLKSRRVQLGNYEEENRNTEHSIQRPDSIIAKLLMKDSQRISTNLTTGDISPACSEHPLNSNQQKPPTFSGDHAEMLDHNGLKGRTVELDDQEEEGENTNQEDESIIGTLLRKDQQSRSDNLESCDVRQGSSEEPLKFKQPKAPQCPGHLEMLQHHTVEGRRMRVGNHDGEGGPLIQNSSNINQRLLMKGPQSSSPDSLERPLKFSQPNAPTFSGRLAKVLHNDGAEGSVEGEDGKKPHLFQKDGNIKGTARNPLSRSLTIKNVSSSIGHELRLKRSRKLPQKKGKQSQEDDNTVAGYRAGVLRLEKLLEMSRKWLKEMESLECDIGNQEKAAESKTLRQPGNNQTTGGPKMGRAGNLASSQAGQALKKRQGTLQQLEETSGTVRTNTKIKPSGNKKMKTGLAKETRDNILRELNAEDLLGSQSVENKDAQTISKKIPATTDGPERPQLIMEKGDESEERELKSQRVAAKSRPKVGVSKTRRDISLQRQESLPDISSKQQGISPPKLATPVYKRPVAKITRGIPSKAPSLLYISRRRPVTNQEREKALSAGQAFAQQITNQKFLMQLRTSQVYCGFHLGVPQEFVEVLHLPPTRLTVTLYDFTGKTWEVQWLGDHARRTGFHSAGWTKFALEHFLEEGDVIVFELPDPLHFNILVHIFPVMELTEFADGWKNHYTLAKEIATSREGATQQLEIIT